MNARKCLRCGWVHFARSLAEVTAEINQFNAYYDNLTADKQCNFAGRSCLANYQSCFRCGNSYADFRDATDEEVPYGSTLQPILTETEESLKE